MANIDNIATKLGEKGIERAVFVSGQPCQLFRGGQQAAGPTLSVSQMAQMVEEILPASQRPMWENKDWVRFPHRSHNALLEITTRSGSPLQLQIVFKPLETSEFALSESNSSDGRNGVDTPSNANLKLNPSLERMMESKRKPRCLAISPDGKYLAVGCTTNYIQLWSLQVGRLENELVLEATLPLGVLAVAFSGDGRTIIGSQPTYATAWTFPGGSPRWTQKGLDNRFSSLACSPNDELVASGDMQGAVHLWHIKSGEMVQSTARSLWKQLKNVMGGQAQNFVVFTPNGKAVASLHGRTIKIWSADDAKLLSTLGEGSTGFLSVTTSLAISPDGKLLASSHHSTGESKIALWDIATGAVQPLLTPGKGVNTVAFSPDGRLMAAGAKDGEIYLIQVPLGELLTTISGHSGNVIGVAFSPDGTYLYSAGDDQAVREWRLYNVN